MSNLNRGDFVPVPKALADAIEHVGRAGVWRERADRQLVHELHRLSAEDPGAPLKKLHEHPAWTEREKYAKEVRDGIADIELLARRWQEEKGL